MILTAGLFILIGALVKYGKMYALIAGYNTMSDTEKASYAIEKIANLCRNVFFGMAFIIMLGYGMAMLLDSPEISTISFFTAVLIGIPYLLIKSNAKSYKIKK